MPGAQPSGLRPIGDALADYLESAGRPTDEAAKLRVRISNCVKNDRLWSIGAAGEQLTLEAGTEVRVAE